MCVCVCSLYVSTRCNRFWWKFPGTIFSSRGRSTSTFFQKKTNPTDATGNLWNWPIGLQHLKKVKGKGSEGHLSTHTHDLTCSRYLWQPCDCYGQLRKLTDRIAAFEKVKGSSGEDSLSVHLLQSIHSMDSKKRSRLFFHHGSSDLDSNWRHSFNMLYLGLKESP